MSKIETSAMTDGGLTKMNTCIHLTVCAGQPTTFADIAARKLATVTFSASSFTLAAGDGGAGCRKATVPQQSTLSITGSGTADHVAIDDGTDYIVTTCTSQALTSGGTVTVPAWKKEIAALT
jgi:hypothetical protein